MSWWTARSRPRFKPHSLELQPGSRIAVVGGGPAGSLFGYFLLDMAERVDLDVRVDIYEPRDFSRPGPAGCNMCGGIVSESLVQALAAEGINLPHTVVQRGIDSYVLHTDEGQVHIDTPLREKRIAAVHRGAGPRGVREHQWRSFDGYLLNLAKAKGAQLVPKRVEGFTWQDGRPRIRSGGEWFEAYDLLVVATGLNSGALRMFEGSSPEYRSPRSAKTYVAEFHLGHEAVAEHFGSAIHIFLLNMPRIEFAAIIPKGSYVTLCILGTDVDRELVESFLDSPEVRGCFPADWEVPVHSCHCSPRMYMGAAARPFADRLIFIGDCGVSRLYKDGIGAAYRTAKAAARTAVFSGISAQDLRRHYWPTCRAICADNRIAEGVFAFTRLLQKVRCARRGVLSMASAEQRNRGSRRRMSTVLWDVFTGSATYREVFTRMMHPAFAAGLIGRTAAGMVSLKSDGPAKSRGVDRGSLGRGYAHGEIIVRQGEPGDRMYVIPEGQVEVFREQEGREVRLAVLEHGDFFGEMALFTQEVRSASVRAMGPVRVLTVDKKTFLSRVSQDPSLAFRVVQRMSRRIRELDEELSRIKGESPPEAAVDGGD